jgi:hypothetical protein
VLDQTKKTDISQRDFENSTEPQLSVVKFHKKQISCVIDPDGKIYVAIKPICEAIGIDTQKALTAIKQDSILKAKHTVRYVLDASKRKFPMQCIPIEYVNGWLFQISENKVTEKAKPKLIEYKEHCYQVLFDHFYGRYKTYEDNLGAKRILWEKRHVIQEEIRSLQSKATSITKQIREIDQAALSGQFTLAVKGGENAN